MKKLILTIILSQFVFSSCKKCIECTCSKNGVTTIEKDCQTTTSSISARDYSLWSESIRKKSNYDYCNCK